jgi:hypothetical protein
VKKTAFLSLCLGNLYSGPWVGWLYESQLSSPLRAGLEPNFVVFFGGVMAMGLFTVVGLILYSRFVASTPAKQSSTDQDKTH